MTSLLHDFLTYIFTRLLFHLTFLLQVDLAGSERAKRTGATGGRLKESAGINQGLMTLGKVTFATCRV